MKSGGYNDWLVSQMVLFIWVRDIHFPVYHYCHLCQFPLILCKEPRTLVLCFGGVSKVAPLLDLASREYPAFYRDWKVISYDLNSEFDPVAHILVRSGKVKKIRFAPQKFATQMERLNYLFLEPDFRKKQVIESIDLSHDRSVFAKL